MVRTEALLPDHRTGDFQMLADLIIYLPFLLLAFIDFAWFGKSKKKDDTPELWQLRNRRYDIELAAKRHERGYTGG
ncbi:MAG: hypothetical protein P8Q92_02905 [Pseudoprimorskyibacter sp.]|jgi:hypothetical protein|nr:hypothetical protein [Pseudoprimorskyibacter sp.]